MARFDDQFERYDPLALKFGPGDTWQRKIALEANSALSPVGRTEIRRIAHFLDALVSWRALRSTTVPGGSVSRDRERELEFEQHRKQVARSVFSDVHLLEAGRGTAEALEQLAKLSDQITEADLFAVLALWKLVDYTDLRKPGFFNRKKHSPNFMWWPVATPLEGADVGGVIKTRLLEESLAEAAYAAATAWRLREAAMLRDGLQAAVEEANRTRDQVLEEQERRASEAADERQREQAAERGRRAAAGRHEPRRQVQAELARLYAEGKASGRFKSANHAASELKDLAMKRCREVGRPLVEHNAQRTVADWLRDADKAEGSAPTD